MKFLGVLTHRTRLFALATAAMAVCATGLAQNADAFSSGGIGTTSGGIGTTTASGGGGASTGPANVRVGAQYDRLWDGFAIGDKRWARTTSKCESGGDPDAIGGGGIYRGAFQFMRSTWKASPKSPGGDPIAFPYRTQAVVAILLKHRDGAAHWPVCG